MKFTTGKPKNSVKEQELESDIWEALFAILQNFWLSIHLSRTQTGSVVLGLECWLGSGYTPWLGMGLDQGSVQHRRCWDIPPASSAHMVPLVPDQDLWGTMGLDHQLKNSEGTWRLEVIGFLRGGNRGNVLQAHGFETEWPAGKRLGRLYIGQAIY